VRPCLAGAAAARDHNAAYFSTAALRLAPHVKEFDLGFIGDQYPELLPRYQRAYPGTHAPPEYRDTLNARVERIRAAYGLAGPTERRRTAQPAPILRRGPQLALPI
jgi:hypothetical protein